MPDSNPKPEVYERTASLRRSDRVALAIPIRIQGKDSQGQPFDEKSQTLVISRYGALIALARPLAAGQEITIGCVGTGREAAARVVEQAEEEKRPSLYGIEIVTPEVNIWEIHFPPVTESAMATGRLLLECSRCHSTELAYLNLGEIEIFQKNKCVSRICEPCNSVTVWTQAALRKLQAEIASIAVDPMSGEAEPEASQHTEDERNDPRITLSIDGCIRSTQYGEDIVQTEDVSESGARFNSQRHYAGGGQHWSCHSLGTPTPTLTTPSPLPAGVTFTDNGNGTATLSGTPTAAGRFPFTITANNGVPSPATQNFTLTVNTVALTITASSGSFTYGGTPPTITASYSGFVNGGTSAIRGRDRLQRRQRYGERCDHSGGHDDRSRLIGQSAHF